MVYHHSRTWLRTSEQWQRIVRHALSTDLEVQMIGGGVSGAPDGADERSRSHAISWLDEVDAVVSVDRDQSVRMGDLDHPPVGGLTPAEDHCACCGGVDRRTARSLDVHTAVPAPEAARTEARGHRALHGPDEPRPVSMEREARARVIRQATRDRVGYRNRGVLVGFTG
jgi:hypothetical protein